MSLHKAMVTFSTSIVELMSMRRRILNENNVACISTSLFNLPQVQTSDKMDSKVDSIVL